MSDELTRIVLISVPPQPLAGRLHRLKSECARLSGSREALRYPPHLTLRTGALIPPGCMDDFLVRFAAHGASIPPFTVHLGELEYSGHAPGSQGSKGCFAGFRIDESPELMEAHRNLASFDLYRKGEQYDYHPHLTLAFDDLDLRGLARISEALGYRTDLPVGESWVCNALECFYRKGEAWVSLARIPLGTGVTHG